MLKKKKKKEKTTFIEGANINPNFILLFSWSLPKVNIEFLGLQDFFI